MKPLADLIRPTQLSEVCGQQHILGKNKILDRIVKSGRISNMIFYGPPGVGKRKEDLSVACCSWGINVSLGAAPGVAKNSQSLGHTHFQKASEVSLLRCLCLNVI